MRGRPFPYQPRSLAEILDEEARRIATRLLAAARPLPAEERADRRRVKRLTPEERELLDAALFRATSPPRSDIVISRNLDSEAA